MIVVIFLFKVFAVSVFIITLIIEYNKNKKK